MPQIGDNISTAAATSFDEAMHVSSDDEAFEGMTIADHGERIKLLEQQFKDLREQQHREILASIDRRRRAIEQGSDPEFKTAYEKIEAKYTQEVDALTVRRDYEDTSCENMRLGGHHAAEHTLKERTRLLPAALRIHYAEELERKLVRLLRARAMMDPSLLLRTEMAEGAMTGAGGVDAGRGGTKASASASDISKIVRTSKGICIGIASGDPGVRIKNC